MLSFSMLSISERGAHVLMGTPSDAELSADPRKTKLAGCSVGASMGRIAMISAPAAAKNAPENTENMRKPSVDKHEATPAINKHTACSREALSLAWRLQAFRPKLQT